jgi:hypothetical protein
VAFWKIAMNFCPWLAPHNAAVAAFVQSTSAERTPWSVNVVSQI